jgi:hypothetical protein
VEALLMEYIGPIAPITQMGISEDSGESRAHRRQRRSNYTTVSEAFDSGRSKR